MKLMKRSIDGKSCVVNYKWLEIEYSLQEGLCFECDMILCVNRGGPLTRLPDLGCGKSCIWNKVSRKEAENEVDKDIEVLLGILL